MRFCKNVITAVRDSQPSSNEANINNQYQQEKNDKEHEDKWDQRQNKKKDRARSEIKKESHSGTIGRKN